MVEHENPPQHFGGKKLLIVEDDAIFCRRVVEVLQERGFQVHTAANGQEALNALRSGLSPDLLVLDMLMPVLDGWGFLQALEADGPLMSIPIVVITATILTQEWARSHGCAGLLRKPFKLETLVREVDRCLGAS